jgi:long-chain acyl-CoA synthetase
VDSWFRSGDLGTKNSQGFVTIVDRRKHVIIRSGFDDLVVTYDGMW